MNLNFLSKPLSLGQTIKFTIKILILLFFLPIFAFLVINQHLIGLSPQEYKIYTYGYSVVLSSLITYTIIDKRNGSLWEKIIYIFLTVILYFLYAIPSILLIMWLLIRYPHK